MATQVSDGLSVLSGKINEGRNISLRERYQQDGFNKYIKVEDVETENFNQRNKELHGEIESKKKKLAELEREGRPGLLTFRRKDWDREVADLKESISQLEAEEKDIKKRMEVLDSINKDLLKLSTILTLVFSRLPGEYKRFDSDGVITVGQVYEKLSQLIQDIMSKQVTSEQREFAGDYKALKDRAEKLKISIEAKARDLGLRSPYLQL